MSRRGVEEQGGGGEREREREREREKVRVRLIETDRQRHTYNRHNIHTLYTIRALFTSYIHLPEIARLSHVQHGIRVSGNQPCQFFLFLCKATASAYCYKTVAFDNSNRGVGRRA